MHRAALASADNVSVRSLLLGSPHLVLRRRREVAIEWEHYNTRTDMLVHDDSELNSAEFGSYFFGSATYIGGGRYEVSYTALREGTHKMHVKINDENVKESPFTLIGHPALNPYGPKSVVEMSNPPALGTAGEQIRFKVCGGPHGGARPSSCFCLGASTARILHDVPQQSLWDAYRSASPRGPNLANIGQDLVDFGTPFPGRC